MTTQATDIQTFIAKRLHGLLFLEEFVFSRTRFSPPSSSEVEFADAVVMLGDVLAIYQIKERSASEVGDEDAEREWFRRKVLGKATRQVRDTLHYLQSSAEINVPNERGRVFNLAAASFTDIIKIVVYHPAVNLPDDCRRIRHYVSKSAGFIHIVDASDYLEISRTLRVPEEVVRYFRYRESILNRAAEISGDLPEPAIAGHFVGGDPGVLPTNQSAEYLHRLVQDDDEWDLAPLLRGLHDHLSTPGIGDDYYEILIEFARLPRAMWREVKRRIRLCIEDVQNATDTMPYRIVDPRTGCGFVFIPAPAQLVFRADWAEVRVRAIQNFAMAHKYDRRLPRCVGVLIAKDGAYFDIIWGLVAYDWGHDPEMERRLKEAFPFRPVREAHIDGYVFSGD